MNLKHSLAGRTLRLAIFRISIVAIAASVISYSLNRANIEKAVRAQLILSTEQTIQRESLPFKEIRELEQNFLSDFKAIYADRSLHQKLIHDFELVFYRHEDGSYTQRHGLFEGQSLADGRRFTNMSATYAPENSPSDDTKTRFALSYLLSEKYGSVAKGRLFNFYGVVPEKGLTVYQAEDVAKVFTYSGPEALKFETYEFFHRGFSSEKHGTFLTRMYFDYSNVAWMTTVATQDAADISGQHRILACVDVLLDDLMKRLAHPSIQGAYSILFLADKSGTLMFHPKYLDEIKKTEGNASIKSLNLASDFPLLHEGLLLKPGHVVLIDTKDDIVALGRLPETSAILSIHYPRSLMQPAILQNLSIVAALGLITLLVEAFLIRSILQNQVARPLQQLIRATRHVGEPVPKGRYNLPIQSEDEIGVLARDFSRMSARVRHTYNRLESMVSERTVALEEANKKLMALSTTDGLTGIANRRRFDDVLAEEWNRALRSGSYLILVMFDVDWFKKFNDHYGHQRGDECLKAVAITAQEYSKRSGDLLARYGGEEFVFIITTMELADALSFADSLCKTIERMQIQHKLSPFGVITISAGVAGTVPQINETPSSLLERADSALYAAKNSGRNQAVLA
ncbi:diguanylate cyclase [uncultured Tolumonas sp.]|uniref:diguanylate cyclase n=1 Tax=uncultured Tolumonas sp. TaxID=263765 RepID=UPI00292D3BFD|nr:diguanylate cyclase [uncultured Tolumonas sp.]